MRSSGTRRLPPRLCLLGLLVAGIAALGLGLLPGASAGDDPAGAQAALAEGVLPDGLRRAARIEHYVGDPDAACLATAGDAPATREQSEISELLALLRHSPLGAELLRVATARNVIVCLDEDTELLAYYFPSLRLIGVRRGLSRERRVAFLAHELAHVPQHPVFSDSRYLPPRDLLLLRRVREAAAEAAATRVAWQLARAGFPGVWQAKVRGVYGDLAQAFEAHLAGTEGPDAELAATRAAFDRWFSKGWRLDTYDRMTLDHLARLAADEIGLVPPRRRLTDGFLRDIGRQGGRNFLAETAGPALTGPLYRETLSPANAGLLESVISEAAQAGPPSGA